MALFRVLLVIVLTALIGAVVAGSAADGSSPSQPCDLVASTVGSDSAPGSVTQPFETAQKLVDSLAPGQTGCLRGTAAGAPFKENLSVANKNTAGGTEADRIVIRSYPGEIAKLQGRLQVTGTANRLTFSGLVLDGRDALNPPGTLPSPAVEGDDIEFLDNNLSGGSSVGCFSLGSAGSIAFRTVIQRNRIHDCTEGVRGQYSRALKLRENLIYDNSAWGLRLDPDGDSSWVRKNIFDGNGGGVLLAGDAVNYSSSNLLTHNIVSNPDEGGSNVDSSWNGFNKPPYQLNAVRYTCAYAAGRTLGAIDTSARGFTVRYVAYPPEPAGPAYRDRAAKDFHITAASPCFAWMNDVAQTVDGGGGPTDEQAAAANTRPNVLFVVTDDQQANDTVVPEVMPDTISQIKGAGTAFTDAFGTTPQCCPGRAGIFSGRYNHNNGVFNNSGTANLDHNATIQAYLRNQAGYRTGLFGKFLNGWDLDQDPPNWDDWSILTAGYCPFIVNEQGVRKTYPPGPDKKPVDGDGMCEPGDLGRSADAPYSTDYISDQALSFLDGTEGDDSQPWFLELTPTAPHNPFTPEADYEDAPVPSFNGDPSTFETDISDKPSWVANGQKTPAALFGDPNANPPTPGIRAQQLRALMSVDDMVNAVLAKLQALGEQDTLVVFTADNGYMWGDHGLINKGFPYTESAKLPLLVRYAPYTVPGGVDARFATNLDLAPTAMQAAGVSLPPETFDGVSLLDKSWNRDRLHTEYQDSTAGDTLESPGGLPDWAATRTVDYHYIESYAQDGKTISFREYYDLQNDPHELDNCFGGDGQQGTADELCTPAQTLSDLHTQLTKDRLCQGTACPPGPGASSTNDDQPPRTHMTAPSAGSRVCCRVTLTADAFDNFGVASVAFEVDGSPVGVDNTAPYEATWDSAGVSLGSHTIAAVATDSSGNVGGGYIDSSISVTVSSGSDVQLENGGPTEGKPETGDILTYSFATPVVPSSILGGWSGAAPDCLANPSARGCVTVSITGDGFLDELDSDQLTVYSDQAGTLPVAALGSIDLNDDDYVSYAPIVRSFTASPMELVNGNRSVQITLGDGNVGATGSGTGTAVWNAPFCGCRIWESVDSADTGQDRDF